MAFFSPSRRGFSEKKAPALESMGIASAKIEGMKEIEPLVNEKDLRQVFPISRRELYRWLDDGCPSRVVGRRRYYRVGAVEHWLQWKKAKDEGEWIPPA